MSITWNGVSSDTIGVIVERIPNRHVPTRRFSPQQVAGRNGNILLVDKSFPNVEQEYEVYLSAESQGLPSVARACAEWLMGPDGYCRLEDSYDTTVYREAFLLGGFDIENILNKFGRCTITFSCKPQKYLLTGDTPIEIPAGITTYTGDVVQFDGVTGASITSLSTTITPTQDLHGYSNPWPAGGGKNLYNSDNFIFNGSPTIATKNGITLTRDNGKLAISGTATAETRFDAGYAGTFKSGKTYTISVRGLSDGTIRVIMNGNPAGHGLYYKSEFPTSDFFFTFTVDADVVFQYFYLDVQNGATVNNVVSMQIEEGPTATSWEPYENICPITGRTGLSVYRTGVNVWDEETESGYIYNGRMYADNNYWRTKNYVPVKPNTSLYIKYGSRNGQISLFDADKTYIGAIDQMAVSTNNVLNVPSNCYYIKFYQPISVASGVVSINYPSTDHDYHAYNGNTYAVDWSSQAGTVYGGAVDVVTGLLTVDRAEVDLGTLSWVKNWAQNADPTGVFYSPIISNIDINKSGICTSYAYATGNPNALPDKSFTMYGSGRIYVKDTSYDDATNFKTAVSGVIVVYTLATPLTYQLTGQEIEVLVGENNVWTSSGPVSVTVEAPFVGTVTNPTPFEARPLLEVSGVGEITINGKTIQILESVSDFDIDCETMEAEDNSKIYCMDFPELSGGENEIAGDGSITALTVTPRWWTL